MSDAVVTSLRAAYDDLLRRVDTARTPEQREHVKRDIIGLFKRVDQGIADLSTLKEDIRKLVDKYKRLVQDDSGDQAPQFTGSLPVPHADHLGASTFIEKGWSLIALGD